MAYGRYGVLAAPEERTHIEVVESPVTLARAAYLLWLPAAQRNPLMADREHAGLRNWRLWNDDVPLCERLYGLAVSHLAPLAQAFKDVRPRELQATIRAVKPEDASTSGLYLSALLNTTDLQMLAGTFAHKILGWRLAPGKTLIAQEGSRTLDLGRYSQGTLINHGYVQDDMAAFTEGGIAVNLGTGKEDIGRDAAGINVNASHAVNIGSGVDRGIHLNYGRITGISGDSATGGTHVNLGRVEGNMSCNDGGFSVNYGRVDGWLAYGHDGISINRGRCDGTSLAYEYRDSMRAERLLKDLKRELKPLAVLKKLRNEPRKADRFILGYDWGGLERRVTNMREELESLIK